jgi:hypothetical protein
MHKSFDLYGKSAFIRTRPMGFFTELLNVVTLDNYC